MLQRTEEWHKAREGRFTASRISEILASGRRDMTPDELIAYKLEDPKGRRKTIDCIGDGLYTYALEAAIETIYGRDPEDDFVSFDMQRGITLEPNAFEYLQELLGADFIDLCGVGFVPYGEHGGASSDGKTSNNFSVEIKCPKRTKFFKHITQGIGFIDSQYIDQMQMQMLCEKTDACYFFNYYEEKGQRFGHKIIVNKDEERQKLIIERLEVAAQEKLKFIKQINLNKQF